MTPPNAPHRQEPLGHELVGTGTTRVVVMNDWLCDTSTWDGARQYLDLDRFSFAFADLRGYGRSLERSGEFSLEEAAADVLMLADCLGWQRWCVVGHSMSSLVALHLAQLHAARVERVVLLTPPPPEGFGADAAMLSALRALAFADDETRAEQLAPQFGTRLAPRWMAHKLGRWRATANPDAVAGYSSMFASQGLLNPNARITVPVLAITGERDGPAMRQAAVTRSLKPICDHLSVTPIVDCGHYPMQEAPPLTAALVQQFLAG